MSEKLTPEEEQMERLSAWVNLYHPRLSESPTSPFLATTELLGETDSLALKTDLGPINLLRPPACSLSFESLHENSKRVDLGSVSTPTASVDDLITMKQEGPLPQDQLHLMELLALRKLLAEEGTS